ncbi:Beta-glucosidase [Fusarium keratoplasticum]|uniref:Beta-glucosidase n=1 Tax=Fusarium keratoplasticum TaxID=1328300 RepID=A0ACC0QH20_9HYPO|nr:Beta-glucosidase [Fusarium keratoplasticum]KAI8652782.1 Beta-glucosidase [Fusarium keratoplasticum]
MASVDIDAILANLSLEEKISLLAGGDVWLTVPIPDKGVPCVKTTDGPNGARGSKIKDGKSAACFPAACNVASTFDVDIARRIGMALGEETLTKGARCLLAPTVCIHRHPLGGRNFESFSEDPFLTGQMGIANVIGLQSIGVSATVKHFAVNEQETQRLNVNAVIAERPLREIYLKPFELIIKNANPWAIMTAYNKINGHHADSNEYLLKKVLRGDWGWTDGLIMSDWGGVNSTAESINAGVDLEMPGPARWRKPEVVLEAMKQGKLTEETITDRARKVLAFLKRLNAFESPIWSDPEEHAIVNPQHSALIREAGAKGIVLLKNENHCLPLTKEKVQGKKIALLGYAKECLAHGGGSASVKPHYRVTPWEAFHEAFKGQDVEFVYSKGAHTFRQLPLLVDHIFDLEGSPGFTYHIYEPGNSTPTKTIHGYDKSEMSLLDGHILHNVEIDLIGAFHPPESASYYLTLSSLGPSKLFINDKIILEQKANCPDAMGFLFGGVPVPKVRVPMEAGKKYTIRVHASPPVPDGDKDLGFLEGQVGVRLGYMSSTEHDADILSEAVDLAKLSDYSIIFTGNDPAWETEGQDQASFHLPKDGSQDRLVSAIAAVCSNTIVVNSTGVAVAFPWLHQVQGLLQTWFPGQEAGNSIVDVLTGAQNPEGHLTCTFPKRLHDCPAYGNFPGDKHSTHGLEVKYEEGVFVGYRHFDRLPADAVNFPFGFGLSYTTFGFEEFTVSKQSGDIFAVQLRVRNTGAVKGATAVQIYVGSKNPSLSNPIKVLAGLKKVTLELGSSTMVEILVEARDFAFWDEETHGWVVEAGEYEFSVGRSSAELVAKLVVQLDHKTFAP